MSLSSPEIVFLKSATLLATLPAGSGIDAIFADPGLHLEGEPGAVLLPAGTQSPGLCIVVQGTVELVLTDAAGGEKIVEFIRAGGLFCEETLFTDRPCHYAVRALGQARMLRVPEATVEGWVLRFREFGKQLLSLINARIQYFSRDIFTQSTKTAAARLVCYLVCRFDHAPRTADGSYFLKVPMTKSKLAARLGITGAHLSRAIRELREQGLIVPAPGGFHIPDVPRLSAYVCPAGCDW